MRKFTAKCLLCAGLAVMLTGAAAAQTLMGSVNASGTDYAFYNTTAFSPDGRYCLVAEPNQSRVFVYDHHYYSNNILSTISTGSEPAGVYITPNGQYACVLNIVSETVTVINLSTYATATYTPPTGTRFDYINNIAFTSTSQYGLVCDSPQNRIHIFKVATGLANLHQATISTGVGQGPARSYVDPSGSRAFVLCTGKTNNDQISVINLAGEPGFSLNQTFTMVDADFDREGPQWICFNNIVFAPDSSRGYVCDPHYNDLVSFGIPTYTDQPYWDFSGESDARASLSQAAISPDGQFLMASSIDTDRILVVERLNPSNIYAIQDTSGVADWDGANNIVVDPYSNTAYIGSVGSDEVVAFDYVTGSIVNYTSVADSGLTPESLAISPDGMFVNAVNVGVVSGGTSTDDSVAIICADPKIIDIPFLRSSAEEFTGYGISNPTTHPLTVMAYAMGANGQMLTGTNNPAVLELDPLAQTSFLADQLFGLGTGEVQGWIQLVCNDWAARSFFLNSNGSGEYMDGTLANELTAKDFFFTHIRENFGVRSSTVQTELFLVNPYFTPVKFNLLLRNPSGTLIQSLTDHVLEHGHTLTGTMKDLFFRQSPAFDLSNCYLECHVTEGPGLSGFALIRHLTAGGTGVVTIHSLPMILNEGATTLYCPHLASGGEAAAFAVPYNTRFNLVNTATQSVTVTMRFTVDGSSTPVEHVTEIPAGEVFTANAWNLFQLPDPATRPPYITGKVVITCNQAGVIGDVIFGDGLNAVPQLESCLALVQGTYTQAIFSHVAHGPVPGSDLVYYNGLSVDNPGNTAIDVTLTVYRQNGSITGSTNIHLEPGQRLLRLLSDPALVPDSWGQLGGYVVLHSSQPFLAFELFTDNFSRMLSAIPKN